MPAATERPEPARRVARRHSVFTRVWHWANAVCLLVLLMSGLQIFNAHPALYWGHGSDFDHPVLSIGAKRDASGQPMGYLAIDGWHVPTTGVLGYSQDGGRMTARAFPSWATLPGPQWLALGRQWHFTAAWVFGPLLVVYLLYSLISARRRRTLAARPRELRHIGHVALEHLRLRFPRVAEYNIIQKLTYLVVLFGLLPLMVLTGLTMSPTMDAAWPWLPALFGGHQSARTIHFIGAFLLVTFFVVHLLLVLLSGVFNNLRSMITGGYRVDTPAASAPSEEASRDAQ